MRNAFRSLLLCCAPILSVGAQLSLSGTVRDSGGRPVSGAEVAIATLQKSAASDDSGHYMIADVKAGTRLAQVRRVGYAPLTTLVKIGADATTADFVLVSLAVKLDTVRTTEEYRSTDLQMMEFLENRRIGLGTFFSRDDLARMQNRPIEDALMQLHGLVVITPYAGGTTAWLASSVVHSMSRDSVMLEDHRCLDTPQDKLARRGNSRAGSAGAGAAYPFGCYQWEKTSPYSDAWKSLCFPDIYLDFTLLSRQEVPNIHRFSTEQLEAMEVYNSPAQLPQRYISSRSSCGIVVLHARRTK